MLKKIRPLILCICSAISLHAGTVLLSNFSNTSVDNPVGSASALYVGWGQSVSYFGVSVTADLASLSTADVEYSAFLSNRLGPGTSQTANEVAAGDFLMPAGSPPAFVTLFSGLTLGPGSYYLILLGQSPTNSIDWVGPAPPPPPIPGGPINPGAPIHLGPGVSSLGGGVDQSLPFAPYVPASSFTSGPMPFVDIEASVPEPSATMLTLVGALILSLRWWSVRASAGRVAVLPQPFWWQSARTNDTGMPRTSSMGRSGALSSWCPALGRNSLRTLEKNR